MLGGHARAERVHVLELPGRVDVEERERRRRRRERLLGQAQHHRAVLPDRVEHHRVLGLGDDLAHDVDRLGLEPLEMCELNARDAQFPTSASAGIRFSSSSRAMHERGRLGRRAAVGLEAKLRVARLLVRRRDAGELGISPANAARRGPSDRAARTPQATSRRRSRRTARAARRASARAGASPRTARWPRRPRLRRRARCAMRPSRCARCSCRGPPSRSRGPSRGACGRCRRRGGRRRSRAARAPARRCSRSSSCPRPRGR